MIHRFETLESTNTTAKAMALAGSPHGTVVIAERQTDGRGRLGRSFDSPAGSGIYMSVILCPQCPPTELMHLTCAVAVAVCNGVENALHFRPGIKWINDLIVNGKKLGGILTELAINPVTGLVDYAIVGIGINCNRSIEDFPEDLRSIACSASMIMGHKINKDILTKHIISALETTDFTQKTAILSQYRKDCITIGKTVSVIRGNTQLYGTALDINENGALIVQYPQGHTECVDSGEVSLRTPEGYA